MSKNSRRSFFTLLFGNKPARWGRVMLVFFILVAVQALVCIYIFRNAAAKIEQLETPHPEVLVEVIGTMNYLGWFFGLTIVGLCAVCMFLLHHVTVHVLGAKIAILRYVEQLKEGKYEPFRSMRGDDELKDVLTALEELAANLKKTD